MGAAGILCNIAADCAGALRGWVWCIVEAVGCNCIREIDVYQTGFNYSNSILYVYLQHTIQAGNRNHDCVLQRH